MNARLTWTCWLLSLSAVLCAQAAFAATSTSYDIDAAVIDGGGGAGTSGGYTFDASSIGSVVAPGEIASPSYAISSQTLALVAGDGDDDGVPNEADNCPGAANPFQEDLDDDTTGDACDDDIDGDGMDNAFEVTFGLDPFDAADAGEDPDGDGRSNLQESLDGTNPLVPDGAPPGVPATSWLARLVLVVLLTGLAPMARRTRFVSSNGEERRSP